MMADLPQALPDVDHIRENTGRRARALSAMLVA
jgi:hypothetical protein